MIPQAAGFYVRTNSVLPQMTQKLKPWHIVWPIAAATLFYVLTLLPFSRLELHINATAAVGKDSTGSTIDIVFAHSHENLTALHDFVQQVLAVPSVSARTPRVFIYTKSEGGIRDVRKLITNVTYVEQLPNVGREADVSLEGHQ